ncbi:Transcriptional regulator, AcrR family [hydrothermal vent metagenome]|uniref:Transcriptional regulator, AcrR family n=1 Tax=hydrothermal vent metagenome TaxID=652676 RepID=A0A3B0W871_9ZZZZ
MVGGRQREFDKSEALDKAMKVFWKKGFVGSSITDITKSMGINKPSMYATFGNKEQLFIQAIENYLENYTTRHVVLLSQANKSLEQRLRAYLMSILGSQCNENEPKGCYISVCISEAASEDLPIDACRVISKARDLGENLLTAFFTDEQTKGHIGLQYNPKELALFFITISHGTAAMARANKPVTELETVIERALLVLKN